MGAAAAHVLAYARAHLFAAGGRGLGQDGAGARPPEREVHLLQVAPDLVHRLVALVRVLDQHAVHGRGQARGSSGLRVRTGSGLSWMIWNSTAWSVLPLKGFSPVRNS
jgi:hypothetical protein